MLHAYSNCPVYEKLLQEDKESQSYRDLNKENEDFFKGLKEDTGYKSFNLDNVHSLYGTLYIEVQSRGPRQCHEALSLFWS
jgi:hypothetical protein